MKFQSYKKWVNENKQGEIIVLFPGSFKPMHIGHVNLIKRYIERSDVKEIKVLIGPGVRNGITQKESAEIARLLLNNFSKVSIEAVKYPSPVLAAYKYMETAKPGTYAMAGVKKGEDYERVLKFVRDFASEGRYKHTLPRGVNVIELLVNTKPIYYKKRTDEYSGQPISASILRRDILNDDFNNFLTNYPGYDIDTIKKIYDMTQIVISESYIGRLFEGGNIFEGTAPIKKEYIEPTLKKLKQSLNSLFPQVDFTFNKLGSAGKKDISGDIDLALSEKTIFDEKGKLKFNNWKISPEVFEDLYIKARKRARTASEKQTQFNTFVKLIAEKIANEGNDLIADPKKSSSGTLFCSFPQYDEKGKQLSQRVQIDINIGDMNWLQFSYYSEIYQGNVKGLHRTQLMVALFANKQKTFRHGSGVYDLQAKEYLAKSPDEAINLLNKLYGFKTNKLDKHIISNFFKLHQFLKNNLNETELNSVYDIYLKILDSTRCDIPEDLQDYWVKNKERLDLKGAFLPEDSNLYKYSQ